MKEIHGDLIKLAEEGHFDVIIHGCNCFCTMGAGIAKTIKERYPEAYEADCETVSGDKSKLGTYTSAVVESDSNAFTIVNAYTQYDWRGMGLKADYDAIRQVMKEIKIDLGGLVIGYPMIGAGLANGDWKIIKAIIEEELQGEDHTLVIYKP